MSAELTLPVVAAIVAFGCLLLSAGLAGLRHAPGQWPASAVVVVSAVLLIGGAVNWLDQSEDERVAAAMRAEGDDEAVKPDETVGPCPRFNEHCQFHACRSAAPAVCRDDGRPVP